MRERTGGVRPRPHAPRQPGRARPGGHAAGALQGDAGRGARASRRHRAGAGRRQSAVPGRAGAQPRRSVADALDAVAWAGARRLRALRPCRRRSRSRLVGAGGRQAARRPSPSTRRSSRWPARRHGSCGWVRPRGWSGASTPGAHRSTRRSAGGGIGARRLEAAYRRAGAALRRQIWDPIAPSLRQATAVFVVPDAALHLVDLAALPVGHDAVSDRERTDAPLPARGARPDSGRRRGARTRSAGHGRPGLRPRVAARGRSPARHAMSPTPTAEASLARDTTRGTPSRSASCEAFTRLSFRRSAMPDARRARSATCGVRAAPPARSTAVGPGDEARRHARAHRTRSPPRPRSRRWRPAGACCTSPPMASSSTDAARRPARRGPAPGAVSVVTADDSPLLRAGLALAGANRRTAADADRDDGILTAEEVAARQSRRRRMGGPLRVQYRRRRLGGRRRRARPPPRVRDGRRAHGHHEPVAGGRRDHGLVDGASLSPALRWRVPRRSRPSVPPASACSATRGRGGRAPIPPGGPASSPPATGASSPWWKWREAPRRPGCIRPSTRTARTQSGAVGLKTREGASLHAAALSPRAARAAHSPPAAGSRSARRGAWASALPRTAGRR